MQNDPTDEQKPIKLSLCGSLRKDLHWKCLILSLLIYGCLTAIAWCRISATSSGNRGPYDFHSTHFDRNSPCNDGFIYIPVAFVIMLYLVYLVECWHCHTRVELQYKVDMRTVYDRVKQMKESVPVIWWKAVCYHYVRRTRQVTRYRNGDAFTTTQVYYERVNSHTTGSAFDFISAGYKDVSKKLAGLENYPATKIKFSKGFSFASMDSEYDFEDQRARFFQQNESRDDYMEAREGMDLLNVNFKEYMVAFADPDNLPWYVSHVIFWIASLFMLSWPLRVIVEYKTAYVRFHVHKIFGTNYLENSLNQSQMVRVNTMDSTDIEYSVVNNNTMVPSYSEALLMEPIVPPGNARGGNRVISRPFSRSQTYGSIAQSMSSGYINGFFGNRQSNSFIRMRSGAPSMVTIQRRPTSTSLNNSDGDSIAKDEERKKKMGQSLTSLRGTFSPSVRLMITPENQDRYQVSLNHNNSSLLPNRLPKVTIPRDVTPASRPQSSIFSSDGFRRNCSVSLHNIPFIRTTNNCNSENVRLLADESSILPPTYADVLGTHSPVEVGNTRTEDIDASNDNHTDNHNSDSDCGTSDRSYHIVETSL